MLLLSEAFKLIKKYSLNIILLLCLVIGYQYVLIIGYKDNINSFNTSQYLQAKRVVSGLRINLANEDGKTGKYLNEAESDLAYIVSTMTHINPDAHKIVDNVYSYILRLEGEYGLRPNEIDIDQVISQLNELEIQMEPVFWQIGKNSSLVLTEEQKNTILKMISHWKEAAPIISEQSSKAHKPQGLEYQPTITAGIDADFIALGLIEEYLSFHMDESIPEVERVKDYIIEDIDILKETDSGFVFTVGFSVQGAIDATSWKAGNGIVKDHGWIEDKFMFVHVIQEGDSFTMVDWNTGEY